MPVQLGCDPLWNNLEKGPRFIMTVLKLIMVMRLVMVMSMMVILMMTKVLRAMMAKERPLEWFYEGSTDLHNWLKTLRAPAISEDDDDDDNDCDDDGVGDDDDID